MGRAVAFVDDRSGVSPVIGVILMVAVTVIIAAVIGSSALGLGNTVSESPPQVSFDIEQIDNDEFTDGVDNTRIFGPSLVVTHNGGDDVDPEKISVEVNGKPAYAIEEEPGKADPGSDATLAVVVPWYDEDTISSGDETKILTGTDMFNENGITVDPWDDTRVQWSVYDDTDSNVVYVGDPYDTEYGKDEVGVPLEKGDEITVVWESGDQSQTLLEEEIS